MADALVTVATFSLALEAHLAKSKLDAEGIPALLADENIVNMNPLYSQAVGGVKLQVREEDLDRARSALALPSALTLVKEDVGPDAGPVCPHCHATEAYLERLPHWITVTSFFLFGIPLSLFQRRWRCQSCGHRWKSRD